MWNHFKWKVLKNRTNLPPHTHIHVSVGGSFLGEEFRIQTAWTLEEKCRDEPWKHLLINILGSSPLHYDDRLQDFWVHQSNPVKEISDACKAPRVQGVGWWSPGWRVDLLAGLTSSLLGTCRAVVWVKAACPGCASGGRSACALL